MVLLPYTININSVNSALCGVLLHDSFALIQLNYRYLLGAEQIDVKLADKSSRTPVLLSEFVTQRGKV